MKKLLSFIGLFITILVLASCSLFKKEEPIVTKPWETAQTQSWKKVEEKKLSFEGAYEKLVEKTFDNILLSYSKDLFSNKFFETKANIKVGIKHPKWEGSVEASITGKYGREEDNNPKADLTISAKGSVDSEQMKAKWSGSMELLLKVIWSKTFINLQSLDIKSDNPEMEQTKKQMEMFMKQWIVSDSSQMDMSEVVTLQKFDFVWFMELFSNLIKENPVIKKVGETTEWEYTVYDIKLDGENIYKVFEWIAKSKYAEDMNITLADIQSDKETMLKDIADAKYEAKLKVKDFSDIILEVSLSEDNVVVDLILWVKASITTLDIKVSEDKNVMVVNLSKDWNKISFNGEFKDGGEKEVWKSNWSLEIENNGKEKNIQFKLDLETMGAIINVVVNDLNTEIDSLEIAEPTDAKSIEEIMSASMPTVPEEYENGMPEVPEGYENNDYNMPEIQK